MAKSELRDVAKTMYLSGYSQKDIAFKLKVSSVSISKWKSDEHWDELKTNLLNARHERLAELYAELAEFNRMIKEKKAYKVADSKEADARRKLITDIAQLEKKYNIGQTISIGRDFLQFTKDIDFEFSQKAINYFDSFINHLIEKQKWQK